MEGDSQQLSQLEQIFRQPDAVMEPNIFDTLCQYVAAHGKPRTAIELLCENYVGYAQMGSLVCDWLALTDVHAQRVEQQHGVPLQDLSAAHFLREQVKADFDPDKFGSVFSMLDSSQLAWLEGLAADPAGRQLIYQLSATHRSCLLLNFAIQKILYAGHEDEVASVGSSLAGYFGVFHRLMASRLKEVPTAGAERLAAIAEELADSCGGAEHSYAHAAQLLAQLGAHTNGANFRRLAQDLAAHAAAPGRAGPDLWRMHAWLPPSSRSPEDAEVAGLLADLLTGVSGDAQKVSRLRQLYSAQHPPSVELLQQPQVLAKLVHSLFSAKPPPADTLEATAAVAAIAAAAIDERPAGGSLDMRDVDATAAALRQGVRLAQDAANGTKFDAQQQRLAEAVLSTPAVAMGVLHLIGAAISRKSYWRETYRVLAAPAFLNLLSTIVARHPLMHEKAAEVVISALVAVENSQPEVARLLLDVAAAILQAGQVELVLTAIEQRWARAADPSQVRYFIFKVLEACAPPYSPFFAAALTRLMAASGVRRSRGGGRDAAQQAELLEEFAAGAADMKEFSPPLAPREVAFLRELRAERAY